MSIEELFYHREGQLSPTIVFVHGITCDHSDWLPQITRLQQHANCIAVDLRGHGKSTNRSPEYDIDTLAADVIALCKNIGVSEAVFVGHSMGTRVVASIAGQAPTLVSALVFVDGSCFAKGDPIEARERALKIAGDDTQTLELIDKMFADMFVSTSDQKQKQIILNRAANTPAQIFKDLLSHMYAWDAAILKPTLREITVPLTVLQSTSVNERRERKSMKAGESTAYLDMIAECVSHARILVVPDVGHFTQLEAADMVSQAILELC